MLRNAYKSALMTYKQSLKENEVIKVESWSHGGSEWQHYGYYESELSFANHVTEKGYDMRFFRIVK